MTVPKTVVISISPWVQPIVINNVKITLFPLFVKEYKAIAKPDLNEYNNLRYIENCIAGMV